MKVTEKKFLNVHQTIAKDQVDEAVKAADKVMVSFHTMVTMAHILSVVSLK